MEKKEIRDIIKDRRNNTSDSDLKKWNQKIKNNLESLTEYKQSDTIFFYVSFGKEVNTISLIKDALSTGKKVIIPYYTGTDYGLSYLKNFDDLELGRHGILEPKKHRIQETSIDSIDMIIVPGLAFDKKGNRIGYGEGNYDKFMKNTNAKKVALCYNFQLFEEVPCCEHDVSVDMIITENKTIKQEVKKWT